MVAAMAAGRPTTQLAGVGRPTAKMLDYAEQVARRRGLALPEGIASDAAICRAFLDQHAGPRRHAGAPPAHDAGAARPATEKQIRLVEKLIAERSVEPPAGWRADASAASAFIDRQLSGRPGAGGDAARQGRPASSKTRRNPR